MPNLRHNNAIIKDCARVAHALFDWAWLKEGQSLENWNYRYLSSWAIPQICRSFLGDVEASRARLSRVLDLLEKPGFPVDCIYAICSNISPIIATDPNFTGEVYRRVFAHEERSEEKTQMGGVVLPMFSNRRQDYEMCHYNLIEKFRTFLRGAPEIAIATGVDVLSGIILLEHLQPNLKRGVTIEALEEHFEIACRNAKYVQDISHVWDRRAYPDQELQIADAITQHFVDVAEAGKHSELARHLRVYFQHAAPAFFWKRLLEMGSERPELFAEPLYPLAIARPVMTGADTVFALGTFLQLASAHWTEDQQVAVESAILALPNSLLADETMETLEHFRDRLMSCLPGEAVRTEAGKALRDQLSKSAHPPRNEPLFTLDTDWRDVTTEEFLRERGTAVDEPSNAALLAAARTLEPIKSLVEKGPSQEDVAKSVYLMQSARDVLNQHAQADPKAKSNLLTQLTSAAVQVVRRFQKLSGEQAEFVRGVLLGAAEDPEPLPDEEHDAKWEHASWSPAPRNDAAQGLAWLLLLRPGDEEAKVAVDRLADDPVPSVRFLMALELFRLHRDNAELMSAILSRRASAEQNGTVLHGLSMSLHNTLYLPSSREVVHTLYRKIEREPERHDYHDDVVSMIVDIAVSDKERWASEFVNAWVTNVSRDIRYLPDASQRLVEHLTPTIQPTLLDAAYAFEERLMRGSLAELLRLHCLDQLEVTEKERTTAETLYRLVDHVIARLYFAFDFNGSGRGRGEIVPTDDQRHAFLTKVMPLLDSIVDFANNENGWLMAPTAHHLMQLLGGSVDYDPNLVLRLAARLAQGSLKGKYPFDSLAIKEVVELVERILADHRGEIRDAASFQNLLQLLDIFASAGWPEALRLVWRLDEVYR